MISDPFIWSQSCGSREELAMLLTWLTALQYCQDEEYCQEYCQEEFCQEEEYCQDEEYLLTALQYCQHEESC